jgi:hypothetical protein
VQALVPKSDLPSYPSEDAVVAGVTATNDGITYSPAIWIHIQKKVAEEKLYRLMAGANTRSDWDAGENLGKQVAATYF